MTPISAKRLSPATRRSVLFGLIAGAGASALSGCTTTDAGSDQELARTAEVEYKLGPGDQLRVTVFGEADLSGLFVVSTQGTIAYPLTGPVNAAGLTLSELTAQLRTDLQAYVREPNVSVEVATYRPFFILGEVNHPGTYPYSPHLTALNAVATAGGFTYRANEHRIFIKHADESNEREYQLSNSTPILPGDTVRIGERLF
ncbi:MAG: polysaccharide biosynthesis/export family protein [Alphaproteobacteria bacterium]